MSNVAANFVNALTDEFGNKEPSADDFLAYSGVDDEYEYVRRFFLGKKWREISLSDLREQYEGDESAALLFMPKVVFLYYYPAFLRFLIEDPSGADMVGVAALSVLRPDSHPYREWLNEYNSKQKVIIRSIVELLAAQTDGEFAHEATDVLSVLKDWQKG